MKHNSNRRPLSFRWIRLRPGAQPMGVFANRLITTYPRALALRGRHRAFQKPFPESWNTLGQSGIEFRHQPPAVWQWPLFQACRRHPLTAKFAVPLVFLPTTSAEVTVTSLAPVISKEISPTLRGARSAIPRGPSSAACAPARG
jgi:hypothetical protein